MFDKNENVKVISKNLNDDTDFVNIFTELKIFHQLSNNYKLYFYIT